MNEQGGAEGTGSLVEEPRSSELYIDVGELADLLGAGTPFGLRSATLAGVAIDSRSVGDGDLFVGLPGGNTHGQRFTAMAFESGAAAALVEDPDEAGCDGRPNVLVVESSLEALQEMAREVRRRASDLPVVAVTGTNGKTTTTSLVAQVSARCLGAVHSTRGNYNNHIGLPLCLASTPRRAEYAVFELGMSNPGEIDLLASILRPDIGIITNIAEAHLETMGCIEAIAEAKAELIPHLPADGLLLLNADCPWHSFLASRFQGEVAFVGVSCDASSRGLAAELVEARDRASSMEGRLFLDGKDTGPVLLPIGGLHVASGFLFAAAVARRLGARLGAVLEALQSCRPSWGRMETRKLGAFTVIFDAYNANPASMRNAVRHAAALEDRCLVALGEMLELGEESGRAHAEVARFAVDELGPSRVFLLGSAYETALPGHGRDRVFDDMEAMAAAIRRSLRQGDYLLVKGSRGVAMERLLDLLESGPSQAAGGDKGGAGPAGSSP